MDALRLYVKLIGISMQSQMQYRADFFVGIANVIFLNVVNLSLIGILVSRFEHMGGWGVWELVFLYCLWLLGHSLYSLFFWHMAELEEYIVQGTFDRFLLRPASPFVQFIGREIQYIGFADVLVAVTGLSLAYARLGLSWGGVEWAFFFTAALAGAAIETALALILASIAFWTGRSEAGVDVLSEFSMLVQRYPIDILGGWFRLVVTGLLPVAFMNYYPSLLLLGKVGVGDGWVSYLSPLVAMLLVAVAAAVWRLALRQYQSAGG